MLIHFTKYMQNIGYIWGNYSILRKIRMDDTLVEDSLLLGY